MDYARSWHPLGSGCCRLVVGPEDNKPVRCGKPPAGRGWIRWADPHPRWQAMAACAEHLSQLESRPLG